MYYVDAMEGEPVVYAGDGNLTALTFGANIDSGVVGAEGAGVFRPETGEKCPDRLLPPAGRDGAVFGPAAP